MPEYARVTQNNSEAIRKKLEEAAKLETVDIRELFNEAFIQKYTDFTDVDALFAAGGLTAVTVTVDDLRTEQFSEVIAANSRFANLTEMLQQAATDRIRGKLSL